MNIIHRLLRKNLSMAQLVGFTLANFIGLLIVLLGLQFYTDVRSIWQDEDSFMKKDYLIVNKKVSGSGFLTGERASFSAEEIADIEKQSWVRKVGQFTSADYSLTASVQQGGRGMSTYMFFESIPSEFVDVDSDEWGYEEGDNVVPIIISKDYLSLYNFGFASSTGLPQFSETMIGSIPMRLRISSDRGSAEMQGRIVGFSNRLNTILVPQEFMDWSNSRYGRTAGARADPSRLIIDVSSPGDVKIKDYIAEHGYEIAGDKANSTASYFLNVATGVVLAIGAVITVLSLFVLLLSISLLMQKNRQKMHSLIMLGYELKEVGRPYRQLVVAVNAVAYLLAAGAMLAMRMLYIDAVRAMGASDATVWLSLGVGAAITLAVVLFNIISINRKVASAF
ncbi:MAG: ABC transporter permease [Muribaculaceae bacterium]|nr:ABC transporter permease [Muribaculaceae bacterium]